jgi:hypothetical protein
MPLRHDDHVGHILIGLGHSRHSFIHEDLSYDVARHTEIGQCFDCAAKLLQGQGAGSIVIDIARIAVQSAELYRTMPMSSLVAGSVFNCLACNSSHSRSDKALGLNIPATVPGPVAKTREAEVPMVWLRR